MNMMVELILVNFISVGASYFDIRYRKVPNIYWILTLFGTMNIYTLVTLKTHQINKLSLLGFIIPFVLHIIPFSLGLVYAGDIKLFMVMGLILGDSKICILMALSYIIGGIFSLFYMFYYKEFIQRMRRIIKYFKLCIITHTMYNYKAFCGAMLRKREMPFTVCIALAQILVGMIWIK